MSSILKLNKFGFGESTANDIQELESQLNVHIDGLTSINSKYRAIFSSITKSFILFNVSRNFSTAFLTKLNAPEWLNAFGCCSYFVFKSFQPDTLNFRKSCSFEGPILKWLVKLLDYCFVYEWSWFHLILRQFDNRMDSLEVNISWNNGVFLLGFFFLSSGLIHLQVFLQYIIKSFYRIFY